MANLSEELPRIAFVHEEICYSNFKSDVYLQGANPSCLDSGERPPLVAAVLNGHHDVIPMLVQKGADVDQLSGP